MPLACEKLTRVALEVSIGGTVPRMMSVGFTVGGGLLVAKAGIKLLDIFQVNQLVRSEPLAPLEHV